MGSATWSSSRSAPSPGWARPLRLAIATGNAGKLAEYRALLPDHDLLAVADEVEETEPGYDGNALLKARAAAQQTGLIAIGDDTGLEIDALAGFPGTHTRRIGTTQEERLRVLYDRLRDEPEPWRARFVCALAVVRTDGRERVFRGVLEGRLIPKPRGDAGFGYDPVFEVGESGLTLAQMPDQKNRISHRARAVAAAQTAGWL